MPEEEFRPGRKGGRRLGLSTLDETVDSARPMHRSRLNRLALLTRILMIALLSLVPLLSCKGRDDREDIRNRFGEPDERVVRGADPFWSEIWYYYDEGIAYEFRRSAPKCGGGRDYYLYAQYIIGANGALQQVNPPEVTQEESSTILGP